MSGTARSRTIAWLAWLLALGGAGAAVAATEAELQSAVFRAKPRKVADFNPERTTSLLCPREILPPEVGGVFQ